MKKILLLFFCSILGSSFAQESSVASILKFLDKIANENIPAAANAVSGYTFSLEGCVLVKNTNLKDGSSWDKNFNILSNNYKFTYYDTQHTLYDIELDGNSFVLGFHSHEVAEEFAEALQELGAICLSNNPDTHSELNSKDSILAFLNDWNQTILDRDYLKLEKNYASEVSYYGQKKDAALICSGKRSWLEKHPDYSQELESIEIRWAENFPEIQQCVFDKVYSSDGNTQTVKAILELKKIGNRYIIVKESDYPSELKATLKVPASDISKGTHSYTRSYVLDIRRDTILNLAHDFIGYDLGFSLDIGERIIANSMTYYSGSMRETTEFDLTDIELSNGFLTFYANPLPAYDNEDEDNWTTHEYQYFKFKIISDSELMLIETDGWFTDMIGERFFTLD